ncbi:NAD-binding protein [Fomitiporia mediterranea MF3/22]|uniref:NAD-binding protein n=1 Tax=Fomitiporia mediterranea (strain MF3/22) TaxID=694068 RepID=UPI00044099AD|nr:NAD-binding protein [Fomitiporia mediterranea MF3/22]EJD03097.1 NAD-binding protein [Fomitiporia mediterranea MF3/22]
MSLQVDSLFNVQGKVIIITGGGTGIGLMMATALENNGATVYILGRRLEVLQKAAKEHGKYDKIIPLQCDVTSRENLLSAAETIKQQQGYINALVVNSGVMYNHIKKASPDEDIKAVQEKLWTSGTPEEFIKTYEVNVSAAYYTSVAFLELLDAGNKRALPANEPASQIITIGSIGGLRRDGNVFSISYSTSKAAVMHMGKILADLLKPWKIRSNIIAPGMFPSEMTNLEENASVPANQVPLERYGKPHDIGGLVLYLVSKAAEYVDGGVHVLDGGRLGLFASTF